LRYVVRLAQGGTPSWSYAGSGVLRTFQENACATKGNSVLMYINNKLVPGSTANGISISDPAVEYSAKDSYVSGSTVTPDNNGRRYRELCPQAGTAYCTITGSGVLNDDVGTSDVISLNEMYEYFGSAIYVPVRLVVPGYFTISGNFIFNSLEDSGDNDSAATYSFTLESADDWTLIDVDLRNRLLNNFRKDEFRKFRISEYSSAASPQLVRAHEGPFQITQLDFNGDNDAIGTFSIALESSGFVDLLTS